MQGCTVRSEGFKSRAAFCRRRRAQVREDGPPVWFPLSSIDPQAFEREVWDGVEAGEGVKGGRGRRKRDVSKGVMSRQRL